MDKISNTEIDPHPVSINTISQEELLLRARKFFRHIQNNPFKDYSGIYGKYRIDDFWPHHIWLHVEITPCFIAMDGLFLFMNISRYKFDKIKERKEFTKTINWIYRYINKWNRLISGREYNKWMIDK
jgi:hypothetical protein